MAAPTTPISTDYLNEETDDPNLARVDLQKMAVAVNQIMASYGVANGFAMLDDKGMLSTAVYSKDDILAALAGPNAGLDADTLDGKNGAQYIQQDGSVNWFVTKSQDLYRTTTTNNAHSVAFNLIGQPTSGGTLAGYGIDVNFTLTQSDAPATLAAGLGAEWISATSASATSGFTFRTRSLGVLETALKYYGRRFEFLETTVTPTGNPPANSWWLYFLPAGLFIKDDTGVQVQLGGGTIVDHGGLTGRNDDDHTQYLLVDGSRAMTGNLLLGNNLLRFTDRTPPPVPANGQVYLYSKGQQLYYMPFNGVEVGPLGAGSGGGVTGGDHSTLSAVSLGRDDHPLYLLRQPTVAKPTIINDAGGNFDFRVEGVGTPELLHLFANQGILAINGNGTPVGARLEVTGGTGRICIIAATTDQTAVYATSATGVVTQSISSGTGQAMLVARTANSSTPSTAVMQISELGSFGNRTLDILGRSATDTLRVKVGSIDAFRVTATSAVFNDSQHVYDFLIKSVTNATLFSVDSNADVVKVGTSTVFAYAALNVNGGSKYGIYAISATAGKSAVYADAITFPSTVAGTFAGGNTGNRGQGLRVTSVVDETATFVKTLSGTAVAAYAVQMVVATGTDSAHVLHLAQSGSGDILRCEGPFATTAHYPFRVLANGTTVWEYLGADPTAVAGVYPPPGTFAFYAKAGGFYMMNSSGTVTGPLGTGTGGPGVTTHAALTDLNLNLDDHKQYVLRQPAAPATETVINDAAGNFNFRVEGVATPNLLFLHAANNAVGINVIPSTTGRLEVDGGGRYGIVVNSTTLPAILATSTTGTALLANANATVIRATRAVSSAPSAAMVEFNEVGTAGFRVLDINAKASTDTMRVMVGTVNAFHVDAGGLVINDTASSYNFIVRSTGAPTLINVSGANDTVNINGALTTARFNVTAGALHGIYALNSTASKNAGYFEQKATGFGINIVGGTGADKLGGGIQATTVREYCASFTKTLGVEAVTSSSAVSIVIPASASETAHALEINNQGQGDHINCGNASAYVFRILKAGGLILNDLSTDPDPPTNYHSLYFKGTGLYWKAPGAAAIGPLGTGSGGSSTHALLTDLAAQNDDHAQYVLRQPTVAKPTMINNAAGDFDFTIRGLANNNLFVLDASTGVIAINRTPGSLSLGRFQVLEAGATNTAIWASSTNAIGVSAVTTAGTALQAQSLGGGGAALITRSSSVAVGTSPVCDIVEGDPTNAYLVLRVTSQTSTTQPMALFRQGSNERLSINATELVINESAQAYNFRVEGVSNPDLFRVQPGNDSVGINMVPSTSGRLEITAGTGRYGILCSASTQSAIYCGSTTGTAIVTEGNVQLFKGLRTATSTPTVAVMQLDDIGGFGFRLLDLNAKAATDVMRARLGANEVFSIFSTGVVVNNSTMPAYDFTVKSPSAMQLFYVSGTSETVSVNGFLAQARFNVQGGDMHGIYSLMNSATPNRYAAMFEQRAGDWCLRVLGGTISGGRGAGIWASTGRDSVANFAKKLTVADGVSIGTYAVRIGVEENTDTAMALSLAVWGTGDFIRSEDGGGTIFHRLTAGGGMIMREQVADPAPATSYWGLYFKSTGLWYKPPGAGAAIGPLASATSAVGADHGQLNFTSLQDDDHPQYLLGNGSRAMTGRLVMDANYIQLNNLAIPVAPAAGTIKLYSASTASGDMLAVRTSTGSIVLGDHNTQINLTTGDPHTQYVLRQPISASTFINAAQGNYDFAIHGVLANALYFSAGQHNFCINGIPTPGAGRFQVIAGAASDAMRVTVGAIEAFKVLAAEVVVNDNLSAYNFRVEGNAAANLLVVNATNNAVGINTTASATARLEVVAGTGRIGQIITSTDGIGLSVQSTGAGAVLVQGVGGAVGMRVTRNVGTATTALVQFDEAGVGGYRVLDVLGKATTDTLMVKVGSVEALRVTAGEVVVNDTASNFDFRVEGTTLSDLFHVNTQSNEVCINQSPGSSTRLSVTGGTGRAGVGITATDQPALYASTTGLMPIAWLTRVAATTPTAAALFIEETGTTGFRLLDLNGRAATDVMRVRVGTTTSLLVAASAVVVNDTSASNCDFLVRGATLTQLFSVNSGLDTISINSGDTYGRLNIRNGSTSSKQCIYADTTMQGYSAVYANVGGIVTYAMQVVGGYTGGPGGAGRGQGIRIQTYRDEALTVDKSVSTYGVAAAYAARINVNDTVDTAVALHLYSVASAEILRCEGPSGNYPLRVAPSNIGAQAIVWAQRNVTTAPTKALMQLDEVGTAGFRVLDITARNNTDAALLITNFGTGEYLKTTDGSLTLFRLPAGGGSYWIERGSDMATPTPSTHWGLYFKSDGLYYRNSAGVVNGPLQGTSGNTAAAGAGTGTVKMAGATARNNDGFIHTTLRDGTAIRIPYWLTITG